MAVPSLNSLLGHDDNARLVILSCDDLGSCHGATVGVYRAMRRSEEHTSELQSH